MIMKEKTVNLLLLLPFVLLALPALGQLTLPLENFDLDINGSTSDSPQPQGNLNAEDDEQAPLNGERLEATEAISRYNEKILELKTEKGAHSYALSEQLLGLGDAYSKLNNHEMALQSYKQALQIYRINNGLHNLGQKPLLERVMDTNSKLNNQSKLNDNHDYLLWLYRRNYDSKDPDLLEVLVRVASWKLEAFAKSPGEGQVNYLYEAEDLFEQSLNILESSSRIEDPAAIKVLFDIAKANFKAQFFISSDEFFEAAVQRIIDIHEQNPGLPKASLAEALVLSGDWEMVLRDRTDALELYQDAYHTLAKNDVSPDVIQRLFARPHPINTLDTPAILDRSNGGFSNPQSFSTHNSFSTRSSFSSRDRFSEYDRLLRRNKLSRPNNFHRHGFSRSFRHNSLLEKHIHSKVISFSGDKSDETDTRELDIDNTEYIVIELDISERGRVENPQILKSNLAGSATFRHDARERVLDLPFRPRLENGEPVETKDVVMLFWFE